jgi:hypothetical protein
MRRITREMVSGIMNTNPSNHFDTHWLEKRVLRLYPIEFAEELLEFRGLPDPLMSFSMAFSQWVGTMFATGIRKTSDAKEISVNLAGDEVPNQGWTKMHPETPVA